MVFRFKISLGNTENRWGGWFGENVLKVKLKTTDRTEVKNELILFFESDLGIKSEDIKILNRPFSNLIEAEFPDEVYELFLSVIEK